MKHYYSLLCAGVLALTQISCIQEGRVEESAEPEQRLTFWATTEDDLDTKTSTDESNVVYWAPHDEINIFYGASSGNKFVSDNDQRETQAGFNGTLSAFIGTNNVETADYFWGVYPYQEESICDGSSVTVKLSDAQEAVPGTFADNTLVTVARSLGLSLNFKHVCSGYKFKVTNSNVKSVTFKGNDGEIVAGTIKVSMDSDGAPVWETVEGEGKTEVTLSAPEGKVFDTDAFYYLIVLPQEFKQGFTMTFRTDDNQKGDYVREEPASFTRGIFKKNSARDAEVDYQDIYQAVDLGLCVKWASVNIGAESPEEVGNYYAWGEIEPKESYSWSNYKWAEGTNTTLTKYNSDEAFGSVIDNKMTLEPEDDVAHVIIGGDWRMPTTNEWAELLSSCDTKELFLNGKFGYLLTSKENTSASIFIPAAGYYQNTNNWGLEDNGHCFYWSSTRGSQNLAFRWMSPSGACGVVSRHYGMLVRAIKAIPVESVSLNKTTLSLNVDGNEQLVATITPERVTNSTLSWHSSNPSIATVDDQGIVTAVAAGIATISVQAGDKSASCQVTVNSPGDLATPLCLEAVEPGTITVSNPLSLTIEYKKNGTDWTATSENIEVDVNGGDRVYFRGDNVTYATSDTEFTNIQCSAKTYMYGNIMSLIHSRDFDTSTTLEGNFNFGWMFNENVSLYNHPVRDLRLPATTLTANCYRGMFNKCVQLTRTPDLPATTLSWGTYKFMFRNCSSLVSVSTLPAKAVQSNAYGAMFAYCTSLEKAPDLPATSIRDQCYQSMFEGCTALKEAPALPATTMYYACYASMFKGCKSLVTAPELPALIMAKQCYQAMFFGCTSLINPPELPSTELAEKCYYQMFRDCTALPNPPVLPATTLAPNCYFEMFRYNLAMVSAPSLPATELADNCYESMFFACYGLKNVQSELPARTLGIACYKYMFSGCTSLETSPVLPAEIVSNEAYRGMFKSCSKLSFIKMLATDISATDALTDWTSGVAPTGTFVKDFDATWDVVGANGVPVGWTVEKAFTREQVHVSGVTLNETQITLDKGSSLTLTATITPSNADIKDLLWSSSDVTIASVNQEGKVQALKNGSADITVKSVDGNKSATCRVTVRVPVSSVSLNKSQLSFTTIGNSEKLVPTVNPTDASDKTVSWSSSNTSVAKVASDGTVTAMGSGVAEITVTTNDGKKTAKCTVSVAIPVTSVTLDKSSITLTKGSSITLNATVSPSNATNTSITWSSENTAIATVDASGKVTAESGGSTRIKVTTSDGGKTAYCNVTVTVPVVSISLNKTSTSIYVGSSETLVPTFNPSDATNQNITWESSDKAIATVSSGVVKAISAGTASITVRTVDGNKTAVCSVTVLPVSVSSVSVSPTTLSLVKGNSYTLSFVVSPSNATNKNVTWKSLNESVATVSSSGVVQAVGNGTTDIQVTTVDGGKTAKCRVTVTVPVTGVTLNKSALTLPVGGVETLVHSILPADATNKNVTWTTSSSSIATVSNGTVTAKSKGTATITVKTANGGYTASCVVTVDPSENTRNDYNFSTGWED